MIDCDTPHCADYQEIGQICDETEELSYNRDKNILCLRGRIGRWDERGVTAKEIAELPLRAGVRVGLASEGGFLSDAIDMVEILERYDYRAVAYGLCASACAQFLFLGSNHRVVIGEGLLAMHGGPIEASDIRAQNLEPEAEARLLGENARFKAFYQERGIDISITYDFPQDLLDKLSAGEMVFWPVSRASFAKKGITDIIYCDAAFEDVNED